MSTPATQSDTTRPRAWSSLFCLCCSAGSKGAGSLEAQRLHETFSSLLPRLNFTSSCYLISQESPSERTTFDRLLQEVSSFLVTNRWLQITLRPVHPVVSADDAEAWMSTYSRLLRACRPFQEEGYREQLISRLRVFPVVFLSDTEAVRAAHPFLAFLKDRFFLPSILVPHHRFREVAVLETGQGAPPWVRVYVTDSSGFAPTRTLEILHAQEMFDKLLEQEPGVPPGADPPCLDSLILDSDGTVRSCIRDTQGTHVTTVSEPGNRSDCIDCLLPTMALVGISYRINRQGATAWHALCDRMATRLVRKGSHDQAFTIWESSALAHPEQHVPSSLLLQMALCRYQTGDLTKAMEILTRARQAAPESADVLYYMGLCEFGWKDYIEAADRFREAIDLGLADPLRTEAHYYRGLSHYHLEEYDEALEPLAEAEKADMRGSPLPFYQGLCLLGKGQPKEALPRFQEAISRGPSLEDHFHVLFYTAYTYKEIHDYARALEVCEFAERIDAGSQLLWNLKGFCHFKQRDHDEAIRCFNKAIEIDPASAIDYANIGSNLRDKGDREGAIAMYRKALAMDRTIDFARDNLAKLLSHSEPKNEDPASHEIQVSKK